MNLDKLRMAQTSDDLHLVRAILHELVAEYNRLKRRHIRVLAAAWSWKKARMNLLETNVCPEDPIDPIDESECLANLVDEEMMLVERVL